MIPTAPQPAHFSLAAVEHRNEPDRMIFRSFPACGCITTSHGVKVAKSVAQANACKDNSLIIN